VLSCQGTGVAGADATCAAETCACTGAAIDCGGEPTLRQRPDGPEELRRVRGGVALGTAFQARAACSALVGLAWQTATACAVWCYDGSFHGQVSLNPSSMVGLCPPGPGTISTW
jgi:hypothetical protein